MEPAIVQRRCALMGKFSFAEWGLFFNMTGSVKSAFFLVDEKELKKGQGYLLDRPAHPDERMLVFDLFSLRCYSHFLLCPEGKKGLVKSRLARAGANRDGILHSLLKEWAVLSSTDYPYEAVYSARSAAKDGMRVAVLGMDSRAGPHTIKAENCIYARVDVSSLKRGESAEKYVENALRAALAGL